MTRRLSDLNAQGVEHYMNLVGQATRSVMPDGALFVVLVFGDGQAHYVSNANRDEMVAALREIADQVEASAKPRPQPRRNKKAADTTSAGGPQSK